MKENIKGFWNLILLIVSCNVFIGGIKEILHQLVAKEYLLAAHIFLLTAYFFCIGVDSFGDIKKQIKQ